MKNFTIVDTLASLDAESQHLIHKAKESLQHAYAPYSKFMVGTAILLENGIIITGTNQENAAYPSGMCAERVALFALASQHPGSTITKMAIVAMRKDGNQLVPATSCGPCRQVMLEFESRQKKQFEVIMQHQTQQWIKAPSAESLLPFCFTSASLNHEK